MNAADIQPEPDNEPQRQEQPPPSRPELHVIHTDELPDVPDDVQPEAPWLYRVHESIAVAATKLPSVWSERQPSFAERVAYSREGDWTATEPEKSAKRAAHLILTLLCLIPGAAGALLLSASSKPSRMGIVLAALVLAGYVIR